MGCGQRQRSPRLRQPARRGRPFRRPGPGRSRRIRCALSAGARRLDHGRDHRQHRSRPGRAAPAPGGRPRQVRGQPAGRRARRSLPGRPAHQERRRRHRARPLPAGHPGMAAGRRLDAPVGHYTDPHRPPDARRRQPRRGHPVRGAHGCHHRRTTLRRRRRPPAPIRGTAARPLDCRGVPHLHGRRRTAGRGDERAVRPRSRTQDLRHLRRLLAACHRRCRRRDG